MKPRLHGRRSQISSHVWPSANSKTSRARRASSARPVRLLACLVSSLLSVFVRLMAFGMTAIVVYKWLLQSTSIYMLTTIELDHHLSREADEIHDVRTDRLLALELEAVQACSAQACP